jgi:hypothetical protein
MKKLSSTHDLLHAFDKAVQLKMDEANRCNVEARKKNEERKQTGLNVGLEYHKWSVWVWQQVAHPKAFSVFLATHQAITSYMVAPKLARERLEVNV